MSNATVTVEQLMAQAGWLRRMAIALLGDRDAAEDAVQDTLATALRRPPRPEGSLRAWFGTVITNRIRLDARTSRRRTANLERAAAQPGPAVRTPEELVVGIELQRFLATALLGLDERHRQVIYMRYFDDLDSPEIAARLGISAGTARWRLKMALEELRGRLDARDGAAGDWRRALAPLALGAGRSWPLWPAALLRPVPLLGAASVAAVLLLPGVAWVRSLGVRESTAVTEVGSGPARGSDRSRAAPATPLPAFVVAAAGGSPPPGPGLPASTAAAAPPGQPEREAEAEAAERAPFTGVRWRGEVPEVEVGGEWAELLSIDGVAAARIVAFSKERYPRPDGLWRKRFAEDLVEVLTAMNRPPGPKVSLALRGLADGRPAVVEAAMTAANRKRVWQRNQPDAPASVREGEPFVRVSPFTALRFEGEEIRVQLDGAAWYRLLRIAGVPTDRLLAFARERYRSRWSKRIAEDPVEVLADLGVRPGATVDLLLAEVASGRVVERKAAPMTRENRARVKDTWGPR